MKLLALCMVAVGLLFQTASVAQGLAVVTDKFGYNMTVTEYASLTDARAATNPIGTYAAPNAPSDGTTFMIAGHPVYSDFNAFLTAWYYTTDPDHGVDSGRGNPSNTNTGFVQLYDDNGSTDVSISGGWTSLAYDTFVLDVSGLNAGADDGARLWPAPLEGGAASLSAGIFHEYALHMEATGLNGVADPDYTGYISSTNHPVNVSGYFRGIFENTSATQAGFYTFDLTLVNDNWAWDNRDSLNGEFYDSYFSAPAIPEPVFFQMGALIGMSGLGMLRLRKRA